jgi:hypothetical protein
VIGSLTARTALPILRALRLGHGVDHLDDVGILIATAASRVLVVTAVAARARLTAARVTPRTTPRATALAPAGSGSNGLACASTIAVVTDRVLHSKLTHPCQLMPLDVAQYLVLHNTGVPSR